MGGGGQNMYLYNVKIGSFPEILMSSLREARQHDLGPYTLTIRTDIQGTSNVNTCLMLPTADGGRGVDVPTSADSAYCRRGGICAYK